MSAVNEAAPKAAYEIYNTDITEVREHFNKLTGVSDSISGLEEWLTQAQELAKTLADRVSYLKECRPLSDGAIRTLVREGLPGEIVWKQGQELSGFKDKLGNISKIFQHFVTNLPNVPLINLNACVISFEKKFTDESKKLKPKIEKVPTFEETTNKNIFTDRKTNYDQTIKNTAAPLSQTKAAQEAASALIAKINAEEEFSKEDGEANLPKWQKAQENLAETIAHAEKLVKTLGKEQIPASEFSGKDEEYLEKISPKRAEEHAKAKKDAKGWRTALDEMKTTLTASIAEMKATSTALHTAVATVQAIKDNNWTRIKGYGEKAYEAGIAILQAVTTTRTPLEKYKVQAQELSEIIGKIDLKLALKEPVTGELDREFENLQSVHTLLNQEHASLSAEEQAEVKSGKAELDQQFTNLANLQKSGWKAPAEETSGNVFSKLFARK